jgi:L-aspartate oxidase
MWDRAGVHRSGSGLAAAVSILAGWSAAERPRTVAEHEDRNLLDLARLTVAAALERRESRGAHHRADFPDTSAEWAQSLAWTRGVDRPCPIIATPDVPVSPEAEEAVAC